MRPAIKVNGYTFRGSNSFILFFFASHLFRGQHLKERICSPRSKFFPLRVDPILKGLHCPGKQTGSHKSRLPLQKWRKKMEVYPYTLTTTGADGSRFIYFMVTERRKGELKNQRIITSSIGEIFCERELLCV